MLNKVTAVTEFVTLGLKIELAVKMAVDFVALSVVNKNLAENADTADPLELACKAGVPATTALTVACVAAKALGEDTLCMASARVDLDWALDNDTVVDEFADLLA